MKQTGLLVYKDINEKACEKNPFAPTAPETAHKNRIR